MPPASEWQMLSVDVTSDDTCWLRAAQPQSARIANESGVHWNAASWPLLGLRIDQSDSPGRPVLDHRLSDDVICRHRAPVVRVE